MLACVCVCWRVFGCSSSLFFEIVFVRDFLNREFLFRDSFCRIFCCVVIFMFLFFLTCFAFSSGVDFC